MHIKSSRKISAIFKGPLLKYITWPPAYHIVAKILTEDQVCIIHLLCWKNVELLMSSNIYYSTLILRELYLTYGYFVLTLQWHHNDHDGVSNHQPHGCLPNRLFRRRSKKTPNLRVTVLFAGDRWIPRTNGQLRGKCFHLMTWSWISRIVVCWSKYHNKWAHVIRYWSKSC